MIPLPAQVAYLIYVRPDGSVSTVGLLKHLPGVVRIPTDDEPHPFFDASNRPGP